MRRTHFGRGARVFWSCVTKVFNVDVRSKSPPAAAKYKRPRKSSGLKCPKKHTEGPWRDSIETDVNSIMAEVLKVTLAEKSFLSVPFFLWTGLKRSYVLLYNISSSVSFWNDIAEVVFSVCMFDYLIPDLFCFVQRIVASLIEYIVIPWVMFWLCRCWFRFGLFRFWRHMSHLIDGDCAWQTVFVNGDYAVLNVDDFYLFFGLGLKLFVSFSGYFSCLWIRYVWLRRLLERATLIFVQGWCSVTHRSLL